MRLSKIALAVLGAGLTGELYALPFTITATSLPTSYPGTAAYTITQNTSHTTSNIIKWLPPNTSISSSSTCATSLNTHFTLNKGSSCTLDLSVSGAVNGGDPDPTHHLMICLSDGLTCTGPDPANSINISTNKSNNQKYVFASSAEEGGFYSCPVNSVTGVVPNVSSCQKASVSLGFNELVGAAYDATHQIVYFGDYTVGTIYSCNISSGALVNCQSYTSGLGTSAIGQMALSADKSTLYVANTATPTVAYCPISSPGVVGTCNTSYALPGGQIMHGGLAVGAVGGTTYGYYTLSSGGAGGATVYVCTVNTSTHLWSGCQVATTDSFSLPQIVLNANTAYAYVGSGGDLFQCTVNSTNGTLSSCTEDVSTLSGSIVAMAINSSNNYLYASSNSDVIYNCPIAADGSVSDCTSSGVGSFPDSIGMVAD
jgi:6-phosphogluconolactonase (cycloisomerase 2 family)